MAVSPAKMYWLEAVQAICGSVSFGHGFSTEGGVSFEALEKPAEVVVGATGLVVIQLSSNACALATISLNPQSVSYRRMYELKEAQYAAMRSTFVIPPLNFLVVDPTNGDEIGDPNAVFIDHPMPSKQKALGEGQFVLALPNGRDQLTLGILNQVGG
ncbi:MAG TPA: hypothetical protein VLB27_02485 [candidate division Zixibacteria bacterium]|nr:hypothetical protein [candidate division Zixibacteria bacterium]